MNATLVAASNTVTNTTVVLLAALLQTQPLCCLQHTTLIFGHTKNPRDILRWTQLPCKNKSCYSTRNQKCPCQHCHRTTFPAYTIIVQNSHRFNHPTCVPCAPHPFRAPYMKFVYPTPIGPINPTCIPCGYPHASIVQ
jgi:hypothetical protein